jgi:acyl dehydratase
MARSPFELSELQMMTGSEIGVSEWHLIDQDRVSTFATVTDDFQFIHVDPERAASTPFGGTIAHGFMLLSLLSAMFREAVGTIQDTAMSMNYGFESVRFISPVRTGKRIRARFALKECVVRKPGQWKLTLETTVEIENEAKPALVASWLVLTYASI